MSWRSRTHPRIGVAAQTTQSIEKVRRLVELIRRRFPQSEVRFVDTVCKPTKQRQSAAIDLARQCDVVIVIGGRSSNNTRELVKTCARYCARVHHVQTEVGCVGRNGSTGAASVGITAGTSTPGRGHRPGRGAIRAFADGQAAAAGPRWRERAMRRRPNSGGALAGSSVARRSRRRMAWVEAASVFYLRDAGRSHRAVSGESPAAARSLGDVELVREARHAGDARHRRDARRADVAPRGSATRRSPSASGTFCITCS